MTGRTLLRGTVFYVQFDQAFPVIDEFNDYLEKISYEMFKAKTDANL